MPSWVTAHSDPARKLNLLRRRLIHLRGAIKAGESSHHIKKAAEAVRLAQLAVFKAKRALIREYPQRDPDGRILSNLQKEETRWQTLSTDAIVSLRGKRDT